MIGVYVTFQYDGGFDRSRVTNIAEHARSMFEGMPGLTYKFFTFDEMGRVARNFYVWEDEQAARAFFNEELKEQVTGLYGVAPRIQFAEIATVVDNTKTTPR